MFGQTSISITHINTSSCEVSILKYANLLRSKGWKLLTKEQSLTAIFYLCWWYCK